MAIRFPHAPGVVLGLLAMAWALSVPAQAPARAPDVYYEPTPENVVAQVTDLAGVRAGDVVYDLGCGDGRIVIAAARAGARGVCVDIDPVRIRESRVNAAAAGVESRIRFVTGDLFTVPIADASVVFLFLWPDLNLKLRPRLRAELRPGTRVVSYVHTMGDWAPNETRKVQGRYGQRELYLWKIERRNSDGARLEFRSPAVATQRRRRNSNLAPLYGPLFTISGGSRSSAGRP